VATFPSTHQVLKAEKTLKGTMEFRLVPVPRQISSDCGLALRFPCEREEEVKGLLAAGGVVVEGWHRI
jgi:hypothetical protein